MLPPLVNTRFQVLFHSPPGVLFTFPSQYYVGIGGIKTFQDEVVDYGQHLERGPMFSPFFIPKMISDIAAGQISIHFGFHGPNYATTSACASSSNAVADAFNLIRLGKANIIVSGSAIWSP